MIMIRLLRISEPPISTCKLLTRASMAQTQVTQPSLGEEKECYNTQSQLQFRSPRSYPHKTNPTRSSSRWVAARSQTKQNKMIIESISRSAKSNLPVFMSTRSTLPYSLNKRSISDCRASYSKFPQYTGLIFAAIFCSPKYDDDDVTFHFLRSRRTKNKIIIKITQPFQSRNSLHHHHQHHHQSIPKHII